MMARGPARRMYEDYGEYEADDGDREEEEEDEKPTKEVLEFLQLRERFKEKIRKEYKKENAAALGATGSLAKTGAATDNKFGSFFGPSQRVIAPRVIEESRSIRETQHIVSRAPIMNSRAKHVSSNTVVKSLSNGQQHKVVKELKRKVQMLKEARDYSFLLSDDADLPSRTEEPARKNVSSPNSGAGSGRSLPTSKTSMSKTDKQMPNSHLSKNPISRDQHVQKKAEYGKTVPPSRLKSSSSEPRKLLEGEGGGKPSQPLVAKTSSHAAAQGTVIKKVTAMGTKKPSSMERAPLSTKTCSSAQNKYSQQRIIQDVSKEKLLQKQMISFPKPQLAKPYKKIQECSVREERPKQKPIKSHSRNPFDDDDDDDIDDPFNFLRTRLLHRYNSSKYRGYSDDDSDMEANFDDIMKEERRSSRIARQEDEEQLRLIEEEEEERRERLRKEAKRRKLVHR